MCDEQKIDSNEDSEKAKTTIENVDPMLRVFVEFSDSHKLGTPITVIVGGVAYSGTIISMSDYFSQYASTFKEAADTQEPSKSVLNMFSKIFETIKVKETNTYAEYLHLSNVVSYGSTKLEFTNTPIRFKLSDISAFSFGRQVVAE